MTHFFDKNKKVISFILILFFVVSSTIFLNPKQAEAIVPGPATCTGFFGGAVATEGSKASVGVSNVPVRDLASFLDQIQDTATSLATLQKECIWDNIAVILSKTLIKQLTSSVVNWVNSGFNGSPSFIQNPEQLLRDIGDEVAGGLIEDIAPILCEPFSLDIQLALRANYSSSVSNKVSCTLTDVIGNTEDFLNGNFSAGGGWDKWLEVTQNPQNNFYGSFIEANNVVESGASSLVNAQQIDLDRGNGFLSITDDLGNILTPGVIIQDQLQQALGTDLRQLELSRSINDIVGALVGQLVSQLTTSGGVAGIQPTNRPETASTAGFTYNQADAESQNIQPTDEVIDGSIGDAGYQSFSGDNLALNAPSTNLEMSGYYNANVRIGVTVDGSTNGNWSSSGSNVAITNRQNNPWWQIDLGTDNLPLKNIKIHRRTNGSSPADNATGNFRVFVSDQPFISNFNPLFPPSNVWASPITISPDASVLIDLWKTGRYVRIQRVEGTAKYLQLSEVVILRNRAPIITLEGESTVIISQNGTFTESGFTATDPDPKTPGNNDLTSQVIIDGNVNTSVVGTYNIKYDVTDESGAEADTVTRTVRVIETLPTQ
ncbi:MAG: DUF5011 domain-containing protein [Parcubacteria group bacterium]|nr:DUF5011 domain-containing protein [Parcubacteria group bacterium]